MAVHTLLGVRCCEVRISETAIALQERIAKNADLNAAIQRAGPSEVTGLGDFE